ncbi:GreA/GreB family elongation factor [Thalassotalea profundi]|uniref:Transcription elongation factor GreAB n=1 Tax=Thalassotalea profundi TaxID=2036687 RepID=A0ABQ3IVY0_9GAMM|nr:GreA/GreB family elongation factor [Thalassotalea profundi]GHE93595.1 hypothetical protein GCM10011501_23730 [Thalassotalea profundi]
MDKKILLEGLLVHLEKELSILTTAANNARAASIDEESVAETQYDTLAIEAGYLAEGQARRAQEIELEIHKIKQLSLGTYNQDTLIKVGSLVQLSNDAGINKWFFIAPAGAGFRIELEQHIITVITPKSPIGKSMLARQMGDEVHLLLANKSLVFEVIDVY